MPTEPSTTAPNPHRQRRADYAAAGFGGRIGPGHHPALLIVDPAVAYVRRDSPLYAGVEAELEVAAALAAAARAAGVPVLLTRVRYQAGGIDGGLFYRKVAALSAFLAGNPDGEFVPDLRPEDSDLVITKQYASAFFGTSLASTLAGMHVDTLLIAGLTTSGCVRASATDALNHGFAPLVVADACGDRDPAVHQANLFDLDQKYADVIASEDAFALLENRPAAPVSQ